MSVLGQIVFFVRIKGNTHFIERIDSANAQNVNIENTLGKKSKALIISKCETVSQKPDIESFCAELFGSLHIVTPLFHMKSAVIFSAVKEPDNDFYNHSDLTSFVERYSESKDGVFFWHVKKEGFFLAKANGSYLHMEGLAGSAINQMPEHIFSPKKAAVIRSWLDMCADTQKPVSFMHRAGGRQYAVTLRPIVENGITADIVGVSTDLTKQINRIRYHERTRGLSDILIHQQIDFERFLAHCAKSFLDSSQYGFDACLNHIVQELGSLLEADWVSAFKDESIIYDTDCFCYARTDSIKNIMDRFVTSGDFDSVINQLRHGHLYTVNNVGNESPSLYAEPGGVQMPDAGSFVAVPVHDPDGFWGVLCAFAFYPQRIWTTREIQPLKSTADIIMSAYLHNKMEKQLSESNRVLMEYDECLQDMLSMQEMLAAASKRYLSAKPEDFSGCTSAMLQSLCELTDMDQACVSVFDENCRCFFSWHIKGLTFAPQTKGGLPIEAAEWNRLFCSTDMVAIDDIAKDKAGLPESVYDSTVKSGIKSLLLIPIRCGSTVIAVLGLHKILGCRHWNNQLIQAAKQFSEVFLCAYWRSRNDSRLTS